MIGETTRSGSSSRHIGLISICTLAALGMSGCGGGGGGGGGGSGGGNLPPLVYAGNTNAAVITAGNAAKLTANVIGGEGAPAIIAGVSIESSDAAQPPSSGLADVARRLNRGLRSTVLKPGQASTAQQLASAAIPIDVTEPCDSGSIRTFGTLNDNGTGILMVSFNDCRIGGDTLTGQATLRVDAFDLSNLVPTDSTFDFSRLMLLGSGVNVGLSGSLRLQLSIATNTETTTINIVTLDNITGEMTKAENLVFVDVYNNIFFPSFFTETVNGRVFDSVHGFVDITTNAPLIFSTINQPFPDSGQILLTGAPMGAGNRSILVTALSSTRVKLELDLDGNGVREITAFLKWTDLTGPVGADLADSDGDGMHNSWETANGLNPAAADAALDKDGDGASNLAEYQAGSDPSNAGSTPLSVDLSISMSAAPDPAFVGGSLTYTISVSNSSSTAASSVIVADTLPAGVTLNSVTATLGSCSGTTCMLGTLGGFGSATVTIVVTLNVEGLISNTATVTSGTFDAVTSNNSRTTTTTVAQPSPGIQGLIDVASPGTTILVGPGTYVGGLNFNGKNVTLQSANGPASTIIHGNQGTAVRMGPFGAIKGFTITGSLASFGAGIEVSGQGSVISGNIFDGNTQSAGGFGAAIGGNSASPVIDKNIFRNNSCDSQSLSGVVAFVNNSSPHIANNIFENNPCRSVNLTASVSGTSVINNTFVGNRTGIRFTLSSSQDFQIYRNNIVVQNEVGLELDSSTNIDIVRWEHNLVFGNTIDYEGVTNQSGTKGNISANPLFVGATAGNYRLQTGSPAIDAGTPNTILFPGEDFEGTFRPLDGNGDGAAVVDIGAFEAPQIL